MISPAILDSIVNHFSEQKRYFFNIYQIDDYITGVYIDNTKNFLDVTHEPSPTLNSQINSNVIFNFFEIGIVLRNIYNKGDISFYKLLSHDTDVKTKYNQKRLDILSILNDTVPMFYFNDELINRIDSIINSKNYDIDEYNKIMEDYCFLYDKEFKPKSVNSIDEYFALNKKLLDIKFQLSNDKVNNISDNYYEDINNYLIKIRLNEAI